MSEQTNPQSETTKNQSQKNQDQSQQPDRLTKILRWVSDTNRRIRSMEERLSVIENNQNEMMAVQSQNHQMLQELLQALQETENSEASELVSTIQTINNNTKEINTRTGRIENQVSKTSTGSSSGSASG